MFILHKSVHVICSFDTTQPEGIESTLKSQINEGVLTNRGALKNSKI